MTASVPTPVASPLACCHRALEVTEGGLKMSCANDFVLSEGGLRDSDLTLSSKTISIQWQG